MVPAGNLEKAPPLRAEATRMSKEKRLDAFRAIDLPSRGPALKLTSDVLRAHRTLQPRFMRRHLVRS